MYQALYNKLMTDILPISNVRANLPNLVDQVSQKDDRIIITVNGKPKAVMVNLEGFEALEETAEILSIPWAKEEIVAGLKEAKKGKGILFKYLR